MKRVIGLFAVLLILSCRVLAQQPNSCPLPPLVSAYKVRLRTYVHVQYFG